jgi:hypothetical protein
VSSPRKTAAGERVIQLKQPSQEKGELKPLAGSRSDDFNSILVNELAQALWTKNSSDSWKERQLSAVPAGLMGIGPKDELEGMLAAQLMAAHHAAMECYRRAMLGEQTFEGRKENLNQANKLSRTYATLLEALNRHRGKGQQRSRLSTFTFIPVRRPSLGPSRRGVGWPPKIKGNPMQRHLPMHLSPRCGAKTRSGSPCRSAAMPNGRCRMHGGASPGAPRGRLTAITATAASPMRRSSVDAN